ncbi:hypothetical protein VHUM_01965 [Vanrija humicola]|uniref:Mannosyltransferase n=1 Tax=Vanrija humicola TaxID=5417 RepID=A0A7D8V285_VANHU|nr:hypothetical protein VHUM_01965 [Vanrija humicola]
MPARQRTLADYLTAAAVFAVPAAHVLVAPYTKVEESFTLHAAHDVLRYGLLPGSFSNWDHRTFPGAVPRSFLPPIVLAALSYPTAVVTTAAGLATTAVDIQVVVRLTLALLFSLSLIHLTHSLRARYNAATARWFVVFTLAQFHIPYYAGRTLPNFTALPLFIYSLSLILRESYFSAIAILTAAATVIRLEIALFVVPTALSLAVQKKISFASAIAAGALGGFGSLAIAAPVDYTLWAPTLPHPSLPTFTALHTAWPELSAMIFNIVGGHSDEWGVMPRNFYIKNLAKIMLGSFPLYIVGLIWVSLHMANSIEGGLFENKTLLRTVGELIIDFLPGTYVMVGALSTVGHKEWRFIVYVIPVLNMISAATAAAIAAFPHRLVRNLARLGLVGLVALSAGFTLFSTWVSTFNYPGGDVWQVLETLNIPENAVIHFPSYPLQTGATLFTFLHANFPPSAAFPPHAEPVWTYSKDETEALLTPTGAWDAKIDYVVTPFASTFSEVKTTDGVPLWQLVGDVEGLDGVGLGGKYGVEVRLARKIGILKRIG